ncbi:MAG TPA: ABC transporter ATP-binding protein [Eubacteriales bacterium]|nr:ABC transporter ATP-binding protein [Eubacteriales bacterium]
MKNSGARKLTKELYRGNHVNFIVTMAATLMFIALSLAISWLMQQLIDVTAGGAITLGILQLGVTTAAIAGVYALVCAVETIFFPRFIKRAVQQYKDAAFAALMKKGISAFSGENTSTYISALSNDVNSIENNYLSNTFTLVMNIGTGLGALALMLYYSPLLTLIAIGLTLIPLLASLLTGKRLPAVEKEVSARNDSFMGVLKDSLCGFSVIKSFKAEVAIIKQFRASNDAAETAKQKRFRLQRVIASIGMCTGFIAQMGVFLVGAALAISGKGVTAGIVIAFVQLMNYVIEPIRTVPSILANRKASRALIEKLSNVLSENVREKGVSIPKRLERGIELSHVHFGYEANNEVLHDVSLRFEAGRSYALVGGSGSGKSTLLNLLMAAYSGYSGKITYDGIELNTIDSESLYDLISIIQQNVFVFNSSIRDNVTMFSSFVDAEVERAMSLSGLNQLVKERGDGCLCGENGCGLSGGEKQRISIARSLLRGTPVLMVDEATAALDAETAFKVSDSILKLNSLTRIVVTHALEEALLRRYDGIIALKNGVVVEQGTFDSLMAKKGYFYSLFTVAQ